MAQAQAHVCAFCRHESPSGFAACPLCGREALAAAAHPGAQTLVCYKCDHETQAAVELCPACGHKLFTPARIRVLGAVLILLGGFLVALMGTITVFVVGVVASANDPNATTRFEGGTKELLLIFGIFGMVIAFGLGCIAAGVWQAVYGRRNRKLTKAVLLAAVVLFVLASLVRVLL